MKLTTKMLERKLQILVGKSICWQYWDGRQTISFPVNGCIRAIKIRGRTPNKTLSLSVKDKVRGNIMCIASIHEDKYGMRFDGLHEEELPESRYRPWYIGNIHAYEAFEFALD